MLKGYNSFWLMVRSNGQSKWLRKMGFTPIQVKRGVWARFIGGRETTMRYINAMNNNGVVDGLVISDSQFGGHEPKNGVVVFDKVHKYGEYESHHRLVATKLQVAKGLKYFD